MSEPVRKFRPPAVPLITVDPYFSIWSFADNLYDDYPRHWTGRRNALIGLIKIDGRWHRFMGKVEQNAKRYYTEPEALTQIELDVRSVSTVYTFRADGVELTVSFLTPLFMDDLLLMSRPVSYMSYSVTSTDGKNHEVEIFVGIGAEAAVDNTDQQVAFFRTDYSVACGRGERDILGRSGDDLRIEWGYLHLFAPSGLTGAMDMEAVKGYIAGRKNFDGDLMLDEALDEESYPFLCWSNAHSCVAQSHPACGFVCFGYDDILSIEYLGQRLQAYWRKDGDTFADIARAAMADAQLVFERAAAFDSQLTYNAAASAGEKYAEIVSLAYRQAIAAHKLTWHDGKAMFFSKECFSNGCIATVDITYPSMPLFLLYNPELVFYMLDPVFGYAAHPSAWPFEFAPHDVGQYPLANGQVYGLGPDGELRLEMQMPVEECGNMIIATAAACKALGSTEYAAKNRRLLGQ